MQIPGLVKIVVNMGVGEAARDAKLIDGAVRDLDHDHRPEAAGRAGRRKSIAQFKLREGMPIGAKVTLRGDRMWEFLDRLLSIALPRIRDFRGLDGRKLDGNGNYTFGLTEQSVFHEIDQDRIDRPRGHGHHRGDDRDARTTRAGRCCKLLGFPFREDLSGERDGEEGADPQGGREAEVRGPRATPAASAAGGRRPVYRKFGLCRVCIREMAHRGELPGVSKASW